MVCMTLPQFLNHSSTDRHLSYFQFLLLWKSCCFCMDIGFHFFGINAQECELHVYFGNCMCSFTRNCHSIFQSSCTILQPHHRCMWVLHTLSRVWCCHYSYFSVSSGWYLTVVLIFTSLRAHGVEHLFMFLFIICLFVGEMSFSVLPTFKLDHFFFNLLRFEYCLHIL